MSNQTPLEEYIIQESNRIVKKWIPTLRLENWLIEVELEENREVSKDGSLAQIMWDVERNIACILIASPEVTKQQMINEYLYETPLEELILHELMHIYIGVAKRSPEDEERVVDILANILSTLDRSKS